MPRSRVIADALRRYLDELGNARLLADLDAAHAEPDTTERRVRRGAKRLFARTVERW